ncbi:MAG: hypothetical protein M1510_04110 [Nitrospirae bacterium]|nr:hypothetical protein [Nitrospirota bacterium]
MRKIAIVSLILVTGLLTAGAVYAWWGGGYGNGTGYRATANIETVQKFQKETLSLRDNLMTKNFELQNEYNKPDPDYNHIASLRKEIIDLQTRIQAAADKHGLSAGGPMGGMMMGRGMMGQQGMMMDMCPMGW